MINLKNTKPHNCKFRFHELKWIHWFSAINSFPSWKCLAKKATVTWLLSTANAIVPSSRQPNMDTISVIVWKGNNPVPLDKIITRILGVWLFRFKTINEVIKQKLYIWFQRLHLGEEYTPKCNLLKSCVNAFILYSAGVMKVFVTSFCSKIGLDLQRNEAPFSILFFMRQHGAIGQSITLYTVSYFGQLVL